MPRPLRAGADHVGLAEAAAQTVFAHLPLALLGVDQLEPLRRIDDEDAALAPDIEALGMVYFAPMVAKANQRIWYSPLYGFEKGNPTGIFSLGEDRRNWRCAVPGVHGRCFAGSGNFVWIGTPTGLLRYNTKTDQWTRFTTRDGLMANEVTSVAVDDRSIWVGTTSGISRLDRAVFERP